VFIVIGTFAMLVSYFAKDVLGEDAKDQLAKLSAAASEHVLAEPWEQNQVRELSTLSNQLDAPDAALPATPLLLSLGALTWRAQSIASAQYRFANAMQTHLSTPDLKAVSQMLGLTDRVAKQSEALLHRMPGDAKALQSQAKDLVHNLFVLENEVGQIGAKLTSTQMSVTEELEQQSRHLRDGITALYLLSVLLTLLSALYGLELPAG
jgi:hypothetical protein